MSFWNKVETKMSWDKLLSSERFREASPREAIDGRNEFENDYTRLVFSSSVRRLQDKAQVFPLDNNDFVRTRLTHSLEVSALGRSIGMSVEKVLGKERPDLFDIKKHSGKLSAILASAGLVHDIGNPPYGHYGEAAIQRFFTDWFSKNQTDFTPEEIGDFTKFEGNAQTFRVLRKLQYLRDEFSFNLTYATLASVIKYPRSSTEGNQEGTKKISYKKFGYFQSEKQDFQKIQQETGMGSHRHPITFLLEAADDIAYSAADIEDGCKKGVLDYHTINTVLHEKLDLNIEEEKKLLNNFKTYYDESPNADGKLKLELAVQRFRIDAQSFMIKSVVNTFVERQEDILNGKFDEDLILSSDAIRVREAFKELGRVIFGNREVLARELAGGEVIYGLLGCFVKAVTSTNRFKKGTEEHKLYSLISSNYQYIMCNYPYKRINNKEVSLYDRLRLVTDFVCGMTDTYAFELYQKLKGIKL